MKPWSDLTADEKLEWGMNLCVWWLIVLSAAVIALWVLAFVR